MYTKNPFPFLPQRPGPIEICDVTLRDGEQTPGVSFTKEEKIRLAEKLDEVGVEVIEVGFPVVSERERDTVREIANMGLSARTCCLARTLTGDIDVAASCDVDIVSVFIATSDLHLQHKYEVSREQALACAIDALDYAKSYGLKVRFAAEDATRTDLDFLKKYFLLGVEHGADLVSIADTVGAMNPFSIYHLVSEIKGVVGDVPLCIHCHNDLGMAVANTLAAACAGAYQLHTTVNGIGERAGNTSLEELLLALLVQYDIDKYHTEHLAELSDMVVEYSGIPLGRNKAVVGANAFAHESGIHVAAILKEPHTYELFLPELVGRRRELVLGKHTGKKALRHVVGQMGHELDDKQLAKLLVLVKDLSERKELRMDDFENLIREVKG